MYIHDEWFRPQTNFHFLGFLVSAHLEGGDKNHLPREGKAYGSYGALQWGKRSTFQFSPSEVVRDAIEATPTGRQIERT